MIRIATALAGFLLAAFASGSLEAKPPKRARSQGTLATLFSDRDYPADALQKEEEGMVDFRLSIGSDGKPAGCTIVASSGSSSLDGATCRILMERARFDPARDRRGRAVPDTASGRIRWVMAEDEEPSARMTAVMSLWASCALGEAAKLAPGDVPAEAVVGRALASCTALEALAAPELGEGADIEAVRTDLGRMVASSLQRAREALAAPPASVEKE